MNGDPSGYLALYVEDEEMTLGNWGFRALRSLIPVIAINESSDCDRPSERSDVRVWLVQFSFSGC